LSLINKLFSSAQKGLTSDLKQLTACSVRGTTVAGHPAQNKKGYQPTTWYPSIFSLHQPLYRLHQGPFLVRHSIQLSYGRSVAESKSEALNPKSETNENDRNSNGQDQLTPTREKHLRESLDIGHWEHEGIINTEI